MRGSTQYSQWFSITLVANDMTPWKCQKQVKIEPEWKQKLLPDFRRAIEELWKGFWRKRVGPVKLLPRGRRLFLIFNLAPFRQGESWDYWARSFITELAGDMRVVFPWKMEWEPPHHCKIFLKEIKPTLAGASEIGESPKRAEQACFCWTRRNVERCKLALTAARVGTVQTIALIG